MKEIKYIILCLVTFGFVQSWDLRMKRPDIQSEVYNCELNCISKPFDFLG